MKLWSSSLIFGSFLMLASCGAAHLFQRGLEVKDINPTPQSGDNVVADKLDEAFFNQKVFPMMEQKCAKCHDNPAPDFSSAQEGVKLNDASSSRLYVYATGKAGSHATVLKENSPELAILASWINGASLANNEPPQPIVTTTTLPEEVTTTTQAPGQPTQLDEAFFTQKVFPMMEQKCARCHDNPAPDFISAKEQVKLNDISGSKLYLYGTGKAGGHRASLKENTEELAILVSWINGASLANNEPPQPIVTTTTQAPVVTTTTTTLPPTTTVPVGPAGLSEAVFVAKVLPMLENKCSRCHDNPAPTFADAEKIAVFGHPESSPLYLYATGKTDGHRAVLKEGSTEIAILKNWILGQP